MKENKPHIAREYKLESSSLDPRPPALQEGTKHLNYD
jgi:hypothetical protein